MNELSATTRVIAWATSDTGTMEYSQCRGTRFQAADLAYLVPPNQELLGVLRRARMSGCGSGPQLQRNEVAGTGRIL